MNLLRSRLITFYPHISFDLQIFELMPRFKDESFIENLSTEIDQLRGRELPGFLSSQAFYLCMSQYVEMWNKPALDMILEVRAIAHDVTGALAKSLLSQYPNLCKELQAIAATILNAATEECKAKLSDIIIREKDPFTLNDFLQQWINKLRCEISKLLLRMNFSIICGCILDMIVSLLPWTCPLKSLRSQSRNGMN